MKANYRGFLLMATLFTLPFACLAHSHNADDNSDCQASENTYRWDLIRISSFSPNVVANPGGMDSALANDGSKITLTGHGTFKPSEPDEVTGGGTWTTVSASGDTASGTYLVTRLIRFTAAPGVQNALVIDNIPCAKGDLSDQRGGLLWVTIAYSDGSKGVMAVSCDLAGGPGPGRPGSPMSVFEGITASKGFVDYWNRVAPVPKVDGNRTLFHLLAEHEDEGSD